jgi:hypothetical protein
MSDALDHLAARVADDDFLLAATLKRYQSLHDIDDTGLAELLGCDAAALTRLRLCRPPRHAEDVCVIAAHCGIDAEALGRVIGRKKGGK